MYVGRVRGAGSYMNISKKVFFGRLRARSTSTQKNKPQKKLNVSHTSPPSFSCRRFLFIGVIIKNARDTHAQ